jgi:DNA-binding transcriptional LysR family regulator
MDTYRLFITIVEQGSFNKAAEALGITQPTVSKQIDRLEEKLGVQLFKRSTRKLLMTSAGERFYARAREIDKLIVTTEHEIRHMSEKDDSMLRVATTMSVANRFLPEVFAELSRRHPNARLRLYIDETIGVYYQQDFKLEHDLFIREGEAIESNMSARKLAEVPLGFYASPSFIANNKIPDNIEELANSGMCLSTRMTKSDSWEKKLSPELLNLDWNFRLIGNEGISVAVYAEAGLGVILAAEHLVLPQLKRGTLLRLPIEHNMQKLPLTALYRREYLSPLARECLDLLIEHTEKIYPRT